MSLEGKLINGIAVDYWKRDKNTYVHFLTSISADVKDAISEDWDKIIFTSLYNVKLMKEFTTIKHEYLMPLKPFVQSTIQISDERTIFVTLIPTKNASGNVMYHFIDDVGEEILYTGYFQHEPELIDNEYLKQLTSRKSISVMYMDNALWYYPRIRFTLNSALNKILHVISEFPDYRFILGLNATGCESLLIQLVHNGLEVYPGESRLIMLNKAGCSQMFSNNKRARIRVVDVHQIYKHDCERRFKEKKIVTMICNLGCTKKSIQKFSSDHVFVITYGEHCTYSDAKLFINAIQPNKILPIITSIPHQTPISLNDLCRKRETEHDISKDSSVSFIPLGQKSPSRQIVADCNSVEPHSVSQTKPTLNDGAFSISLYNDFSPFIGGEDIPQRAVITTKQMAPTQTDDLEFNINTQSDFQPPFTSTQQTLSQKTGQRALHVIEEEPGEESINREMLPPSQFSQLPSQKKKNNMNRYIELSEDQLRNKNKFSRSHIWEIFNANSVNRVSVVSNVKNFKDAECQTDLLADDITLRQKQISVEDNVVELRTIEEEGEENDLDYSTQTYITIRPIEKNVVFNSAFNVYHDISNEDVENVSPSVARNPGNSLNESFSTNTQMSETASQEVTINKTYIIQKSVPNNSIDSIDMFDNSVADPILIKNVHEQPETNPLVNELEHGTWSNNVEIIETHDSQIVYIKSENADDQFEEEIPNIGGSVEIWSEEVNSVSQVDLVSSSDSLEDILNPNIQACKIIHDDILENHEEAGDVTLQLVKSGEPQHMQRNIIVNVKNVPEMILETSYEMSSLCDSGIIAAYPCESRTEIALENLPIPASCKMIEPDSENEDTDTESPLRLAPIALKKLPVPASCKMIEPDSENEDTDTESPLRLAPIALKKLPVPASCKMIEPDSENEDTDTESPLRLAPIALEKLPVPASCKMIEPDSENEDTDTESPLRLAPIALENLPVPASCKMIEPDSENEDTDTESPLRLAPIALKKLPVPASCKMIEPDSENEDTDTESPLRLAPIALENLPVPASCKMIEPDSENEDTVTESPLRLAPIDLEKLPVPASCKMIEPDSENEDTDTESPLRLAPIDLEKLPVPASCKMIEPDSENENTDIELPLRLAPIEPKKVIDHMKESIQTDSNRQTEGPKALQETVDKLNNQKYVSSNDQLKKNYEIGSSSKSVRASESKQVQLQEAIVINASSSEEGDDNIADGTARDQSTAYGSVGDASRDEVIVGDVYIGYGSVGNVPSDISVSSSSDSEYEEKTCPRESPIVSEESRISNYSTCSRKMNPCISQMISPRINPDISPTIYNNISSRHSARNSPVELVPYSSVKFSPDLVHHCRVAFEQNMSSSNETAGHISSDNTSQISMTTVEKSQCFNKCKVLLERLDTETIDRYLRRNTTPNHKTESKSNSKNKFVHVDKIDAYAKYFVPLIVSHKGRMQLDDADRDVYTKNINQIRNFLIRCTGKQPTVKSFTRKHRKRNASISSDDEPLQRIKKKKNRVILNISGSSDDEPANMPHKKKKKLTRKKKK